MRLPLELMMNQAANADVIRKGFTQQLQESLGGDKKRRMLLAKSI